MKTKLAYICKVSAFIKHSKKYLFDNGTDGDDDDVDDATVIK